MIGHWHIVFKTHPYLVSPPVDLLRWVFCVYDFGKFVVAVAGNVISVVGSRWLFVCEWADLRLGIV